ncbi:MAG TPA: adenosylcobinamide-GDP ribazoletransferase [Microscillaceae bacterium]|nr:adenosylcobinamide-GDP ribazoletransferase [Microscillaceae bacterium]
MRQQIHIFLTAVMFYTRIPVPHWVDHKPEYLNKATIYFPVIGWMVGGYTALIYFLCQLFFPVELAILLSFAAGIWMTGAFHEDGFADVCDGFGGGWTQEKILTIMKDSRVGAFGAIGMIILFLVKFFALKALAQDLKIVPILIIAHTLSRYTALTFIFTHEYVRENEDSKAKPIAKKLSMWELLVATILGQLPLLLLYPQWSAFLVLVPLLLLKQYLAWYFKKWIGGYTGDCLGATQQLTEVVIYLFFIAWLQNA